MINPKVSIKGKLKTGTRLWDGKYHNRFTT